MSPWAAIAAAVGAVVPKLLGPKKKFNLWYWYQTFWTKEGGPYSYRQCRKTMAVFVRLGMKPSNFVILRDGAKPPKEGPAWE